MDRGMSALVVLLACGVAFGLSSLGGALSWTWLELGFAVVAAYSSSLTFPLVISDGLAGAISDLRSDNRPRGLIGCGLWLAFGGFLSVLISRGVEGPLTAIHGFAFILGTGLVISGLGWGAVDFVGWIARQVRKGRGSE